MGKRSRGRAKLKVPTSDYSNADGDVLRLRGSLSPSARGEYAQALAGEHA